MRRIFTCHQLLVTRYSQLFYHFAIHVLLYFFSPTTRNLLLVGGSAAPKIL
jgi:hypothetical protein